MISARTRRAAATRYPQHMDWFSKRPEHQTNATRLRGRPSVTEISPGLLVGEFPRPDDIAWLKSEFGVTAIHNLQDDEDLALNGLRERELAEAEKWQLEQALATSERLRRGEERIVPWENIERVFDEALGRRSRRAAGATNDARRRR